MYLVEIEWSVFYKCIVMHEINFYIVVDIDVIIY